MTPARERSAIEAELHGLRELLRSTPEDPVATPLLRSQVEELDQSLRVLDRPSLRRPEAELFFTDGPAQGSEGLDITFTAEVLNSYQNMLTNHYAAKHFGALRRTGRRRGEDETRLFLTALPRGSFGLQLTQPQISDFIAANQVSDALLDLSDLVAATVAGDHAFELAVAAFDARVFKPLKRFLEAIHSGGGTCRLLTGNKELRLDLKQIAGAHQRISAAVAEDQEVTLSGVFGGVVVFSGNFEFQPDSGELIRGSLDPELSEDAARAMNRDFTRQRAVAKLRMTTISTRAGKRRPSYELTKLLPIASPAVQPEPTPHPPNAPQPSPPRDGQPTEAPPG